MRLSDVEASWTEQSSMCIAAYDGLFSKKGR